MDGQVLQPVRQIRADIINSILFKILFKGMPPQDLPDLVKYRPAIPMIAKMVQTRISGRLEKT